MKTVIVSILESCYEGEMNQNVKCLEVTQLWYDFTLVIYAPTGKFDEMYSFMS